ncbi:MAG: DUF4292 domain-containing protein [Myxococcales bacterium]|nr:DUF4292 domain-containing protein [Myxococcales bacterium]
MRPVSLLLVALAGLALTGCPDRYRRPDDLQTDPAPYVQAVRDRNAAVHALAGELALEVWRGSERVRLKQLFAVQVPDRLRLSALTPFGQELSVLVSDGETLSIWAQDEKRFYQGAASAENLGRLVPVPLEPEALAALLRGSVPLLAGAEQQAVTWNGAEGWAVLRLTRGDVEEQIGFEPEHRRIVSLRLERAG